MKLVTTAHGAHPTMGNASGCDHFRQAGADWRMVVLDQEWTLYPRFVEAQWNEASRWRLSLP